MRKHIVTTSRSFAFAIAAFALTTTSALAFANQEFLTQAGLSDDQVVAIQEARELRKLGDVEAARDVLIEAGIDLETLRELRKAHHQEQRQAFRQQLAEQLTDEQQEALQVARAANDKETARAILEEAGIERPERGHRHHHAPARERE